MPHSLMNGTLPPPLGGCRTIRGCGNTPDNHAFAGHKQSTCQNARFTVSCLNYCIFPRKFFYASRLCPYTGGHYPHCVLCCLNTGSHRQPGASPLPPWGNGPGGASQYRVLPQPAVAGGHCPRGGDGAHGWLNDWQGWQRPNTESGVGDGRAGMLPGSPPGGQAVPPLLRGAQLTTGNRAGNRALHTCRNQRLFRRQAPDVRQVGRAGQHTRPAGRIRVAGRSSPQRSFAGQAW